MEDDASDLPRRGGLQEQADSSGRHHIINLPYFVVIDSSILRQQQLCPLGNTSGTGWNQRSAVCALPPTESEMCGSGPLDMKALCDPLSTM